MANSQVLKLVIDTNLWISFIISNKLNELEPILLNKNCKILFSSELVGELQATITKPKLQQYFSNNALEEMLNVFDEFIEFVDVKSKVQICRDPNDDFLLAISKDGKADFLITGDKDLLEIEQFEETSIIKYSDFLESARK